MKLVKHLLDAKGSDVLTIGPDESVLDGLRLMADKGVGSLMVMDGATIAGILTERDYARKVVLKGRASTDTPVREIMTSRVLTASTGDTVQACMNLMTDERVRHLPIVDDGLLVGIISIGDLVKAIIAEQKEEIEHLEHYISG